MSLLLKNKSLEVKVDSELSPQDFDKYIKNKKSINSDHLISLFNGVFSLSHNTCLLGNGAEPEYRPADQTSSHHRIIFTQDYVASALHEVAHWCVAGAERREQVDYGYWYIPDGRNPQQQALFERVEVKPQALEWIFSKACGLQFRVSADNLNGDQGSSLLFKQRIVEQARKYCLQGLNDRAEKWVHTLQAAFTPASPSALDSAHYSLETIK